ncbi:MAG: tetratricopeptide repeat protein [Verrucomicrobiota bacterium]
MSIPLKPAAHTRGTLQRKGLVLWLGLALFTAVAFNYFPMRHADFINFDDPDYVTQNPWIKAGVNWEGIKTAFETGHASNWHPITWLSHMLDCQFYGLNAGAHHLTNVAFHALNTVLLFLLLYRLTGTTWRSAITAGFFGLHPLHVESVAWVSERKDVLAALFGLLTLIAYSEFARRKSQGPACNCAKLWYGSALVFYSLGLMSKPILVTWPFIMLLLDYWPLDRALGRSEAIRGCTLKKCIGEKLPFLFLTIVSCILTFVAQRTGGSVANLNAIPLGARFANAALSYAGYLQKMAWPNDLAAYYPFPTTMQFTSVGLALLIGAAVSYLIFRNRHQHPYLWFGWLWYLGTLVPVIGIVQVGGQAMADRYTYITLIGPFIAIVWGVEKVLGQWPNRVHNAAIISIIPLSLCAVLTWKQCNYWKNSESLHRHTLAITSQNPITHLNLGSALAEQGRMTEAATEYAQAIQLRPDYAEAYSNLGFALAAQGKHVEAIEHYTRALHLKPNPKTEYLLGNALCTIGKTGDGINAYRKSIAQSPNNASSLNDLAWILATHPDSIVRNGSEAVDLSERANALTKYGEPMFLAPWRPLTLRQGDSTTPSAWENARNHWLRAMA